MKGLLLVNKDVGWTSFDVVSYVRKIIASEQKLKPAQIKVGHAGTLDPLATGLLLLLIGKEYTKKANQFSKLDKDYLVDIKLGEITPSGDLETNPTLYSKYKPSNKEVEQTLKALEGKIMQLPPIFSALKINGQRAYKLARAGKQAELKPRPVEIYSLKLINYSYPNIKLATQVSSGTYIRSLVVDIGNQLKTGAYMASLSRTRVGKYKLEDALSIKQIDYEQISSHIRLE
ncbi:MAG: tRNA pseudouridine(55) synthase TruB [Candidatus Saccharimonadales bacterium]